jgi:uncharacterized protein (DUF2336 family)
MRRLIGPVMPSEVSLGENGRRYRPSPRERGRRPFGFRSPEDNAIFDLASSNGECELTRRDDRASGRRAPKAKAAKQGQAAAELIEVRDRLRQAPSADARAAAATHVGSLLTSTPLKAEERSAALAILEKLTKDVEQEVRHALAVHVKDCAVLPPSIAREIAEDVDAVSLPFIECSPVLSDGDLIDLVKLGSTQKQLAIARRDSVSEPVSDALVATHSGGVVIALLTNVGARVSEPAYHDIVEHFGGDRSVQSLIVERPLLPMTVIERLIHSVSTALRNRLIERHALPSDFADELVGQAGERAFMQDLASMPGAFDAEALARRLHANGRLTPTLLMRALCLGDRHFFEAGIAVRAGIPTANAATLMADRGPLGFKALYDKAQLPAELFRAFRAAFNAIGEVERSGRKSQDADSVRLIIDAVVKEYDEACPDSLEYLLSQISHGILGRFERSTRN